jgi:hypothetical protein
MMTIVIVVRLLSLVISKAHGGNAGGYHGDGYEQGKGSGNLFH